LLGGGGDDMAADILAGLVGTFFIVSVLSMLWKDNIVFRFGQAAIIGASMAHYCFMNTQMVYIQGILPMSQGKIALIIPLITGLLLYSRLNKGIAWLARYPTNFLVGVGSGLMIAGTLRGQIIDQAKQTIVDLFAGFSSDCPVCALNGVIILVGVVASLSFFVFTREHEGTFGYVTKLGRVFLMISLGANFAGELVWYLTQMIGRLMFILNQFIWPLLGMA
jgi:hypothetical protein